MAHATCALIIPVYAFSTRRLAFLDSCLASLVRQSVPALGVVVDDGFPLASDVESLVAEHGRKGLLRYVSRSKPSDEARTSAGALNHGIKLLLDDPRTIMSASESSSIDAFCYLHSDDLLPRESVEYRSFDRRGAAPPVPQEILDDPLLNGYEWAAGARGAVPGHTA